VDTIITELAVIDVVAGELHLREMSAQTDLDTVLSQTGAEILLPQGEIPRF
jgi:acyl CoA:acetate/3-ketoacid CoA transferase beta subunit